MPGPHNMPNGPGTTLSENNTQSQDNERICKFCSATKGGRKLVLALDGASNQFGKYNSNVFEIYARVEKNKKQLTYYNSGIGTYANPSRKWSWKNFKMALDNKIDLAIAWNFERVILASYRWLSDNYQPGDQIFLFGFSRGAYQARVLAGMIHKVGLIHSGNEEQIPFAYELYTDSVGDLVTRFREAFSHKDASVHFVGVWDTVSSVGFFRSKNLPATDDWKHICFFRHALALDERRVKFLPECVTNSPEFANGYSPGSTDAKLHEPQKPDSRGHPEDSAGAKSHDPRKHDAGKHPENSTETKSQPRKPDSSKQPVAARRSPSNFSDEERVKEVWFAGCHSDIGGSNDPNDKLLMEEIPALWIANEARTAGLAFKSTSVEWNWEKLRHQQRTDSLWGPWWILEAIPFLNWPQDCPRRRGRLVPHLGRPRCILSGQKIHVSVAFMQGYKPRAKLLPSSPRRTWNKIIGKGDMESMRWTKDTEEMLELDLYDTSAATGLIKHLRDKTEVKSALDRLSILALTAPGVQSIIEADDDLETLAMILSDSRGETRKLVAVVLGRVASHRPGMSTLWKSKIPRHLHDLLGKETEIEKSEGQALSRALLQLYQPGFTTRRPDSLPFIIGALSTGNADLAVSALGVVVEDDAFPPSAVAHSHAIVDIQDLLSNLPSVLDDTFNNKTIPACIRASAACKLTEIVKPVRNSILAGKIILSESVIGSLAGMLDLKHRDVLTSIDPSKFVGQSRLSGPKNFLSSIFTAKDDPNSKRSTLCSMLDVSEGEDVAQVFPPEVLEKLADVHGMTPSGSIGSLQPEFIDWLEQALRRQLMFTQASTILSLSRLLDFRLVLKMIFEKPVFDILKDLFGSKDKDVRENATSALANLAKNGELREKIFQVGIVKSLGHRLRSLESGVQQSAVEALSELAKYEKLRSEILWVGIIGLLAKLLGSKDSGVCRSATDALSGMTRYSDLRTEILKLRFVESLQKQLESQDENLQRSAIMALSGLTKYDSVRTNICKIGILTVLGKALISTDYFVQVNANRTLLQLVEYDSLKSDIGQLKLVEFLKKSLNSGDNNVQCSAAKVLLCLLDLVKYDEIRSKILKLQIIESLVKLLGSRYNDTCCSAINALSALTEYGELREKIVKAGFVNLLRKHLGSEDHNVQQSAIKALSALTENGEPGEEILAIEFVESLQNLLGSEDHNVKRSVIDALSGLTRYDSVRAQILEFGFVDLLGNLLKSATGLMRYCVNGALMQLAEYENVRVDIFNVDILHPICKMITNTDRFERQSAIEVLLKLVEYELFRPDILKLKLVESLKKSLGSGDSGLQSSAAKALLGIAKLAEYDEIRWKILDLKIIESLGRLLGSEDSGVCSSAIEALSALTENGGLCNEILEARFVNSLQKRLGSEDHNVQRSAIEALCSLAKYDSVRTQVLKFGFINLLGKLLKSANVHVRHYANETLLKLVEYENVRVEILGAGILDSLGNLLGSQDGDVCRFAIEVLTGLTEYGELRTEILGFGFINSLQQFLGSDDIYVRHATVQALRALRRYDDMRQLMPELGVIDHLSDSEHTLVPEVWAGRDWDTRTYSGVLETVCGSSSGTYGKPVFNLL